jgi:hypothetical protein
LPRPGADENLSEVKSLLLLIPLVIATCWPLMNVSESLAGSMRDPLAHAAMAGFYCENILTWRTHTDRFVAPMGVDLSNSYDSPFPMILTCPFHALGSQAMFHIFAFLEVLLVVLAAWLVARNLFEDTLWQLAYVGTVWWSGFYIARIHEHYTLLAGIWGFQLLLWMILTAQWSNPRKMALFGFLTGLVFAGTFQNIAMLSLPLAVLAGVSAYENRARFRLAKTWWSLGLALLTFGATFFALFGPSIVGFFTKDLPSFYVARSAFNLDLLSPLLPWRDNLLYPWFGVVPPLAYERYNGFDPIMMALVLVAVAKKDFRRLPWVRPLLVIALFSWLYALGPDIRFYNHVLGANPLDRFIGKIPPLSFSRTPARFAAVSYLALVFVAFSFMRAKKWTRSKWLAAGLIGWTTLTGPVLNRELTVPVVEYKKYLPMKALAYIKAAPAEDRVLSVPSGFTSDPSQDFMQLLHGKSISGGYLAYTTFTAEALKFDLEDPLLSQLICRGTPLRTEAFLNDDKALREHLQALRFHFVIVNKALLSSPQCRSLAPWVIRLARRPWIKTLEENPSFAVLEIVYLSH